MKAAWFHSTAFHGTLVVLASLLSFALTWVVDALHSGALQLGPGLAVFSTLIVGLLTILGVAIRNWIESQPRPPVPAPSPTPPAPPQGA